jgi:hypothetical protein
VQRTFVALVVGALGLVAARCCYAELPCAYLDDTGTVQRVESPAKVTPRLRYRVICADSQPNTFVAPEEVKLQGLTREASFVTELGQMQVRWPRSVEQCFRKSPSRAVADAASAASRAIKTGRFATEVKTARREWSLVFTDKKSAMAQFPMALSLGGHPGFMVPPSNIYIMSDYIAPSCAAGEVGDAVLSQVLLHEIGHVLEYVLLGERDMASDRQRAEGFAAWFEIYSSDYSSAIPRGQVRHYYQGLAKQALQANARGFSGTAQDYGRAAFNFLAITDRRGVAGLMEIYALMRDERLSFQDAVSRKLRWTPAMFEKEAVTLING